MKKQTFNIVTGQSIIAWTGRKVTGSHNGTIALQQGTLTLNEGQLTTGRFVIDTTSITILDITDPATNAQFAGHLASDDFFASEQYPEAVFEITSVDGSHITGNLTIKGITRPVGFDADINISGDTLTAAGKIVIDRTQFGIKFRSGNFFQNLGDTLIYNDFDLDLNITAKAAVSPALA